MPTIAQLMELGGDRTLVGELHCQLENTVAKLTREGKPYCELHLADEAGRLTLRAWNDHPDSELIPQLAQDTFLAISGTFYCNKNYGPDARHWRLRVLDDVEAQALINGSQESAARVAAEFQYITGSVAELKDPRLRGLSMLFLERHGARMRRTAAARSYHHARRGGLVEHVAQMLRSAHALSAVYTELNRELLLAGVLFHDCGKLWENAYPEQGFAMGYHEAGELLGHIVTGIEVVNKLWRDLMASDEAQAWSDLRPVSEDVRVHLLHLLAAHHGELEFGSPVTPRTPEAAALHYIDNMDAKLEMFRMGYQRGVKLAPRVYERVRPLTGNLVEPLPGLSLEPSQSATMG